MSEQLPSVPYECPNCGKIGEYNGGNTVQFQCPDCTQRLYIKPDRSGVVISKEDWRKLLPH